MTAAVLAASIVPVLATSSSAAVPTFPDNIVVFPDRDFVTVEGYQGHIGDPATITVTRAGTTMGSAVGTVAEGDVAFEVNHPGGYCWGEGGGPAVTPDIQKGDIVSIHFADGTTADTTVSSGTATTHATRSGSTVTVTGTYGADVDPGQVEARIVNPDLTPHIGRRDVRAVPGGPTRAPKGGYTSDLVMSNGTFTATFTFDDVKAAEIAESTGVERFMSWQVEDADANRQGLTISEFGESGGPGMGGCPTGPDAAAPATATYSTVRSADKTKLAVTWTAADPVPGAAPTTGFSVEAVQPDGTVTGARVGATASSVTLTVDPAVTAYAVEVRSMADARMGDPYALAPTSGTGPLPTDQTPPVLTATPAPGRTAETAAEASSVALTSESSADIYYTTDGSPAVNGDLPGDRAQLYASPIAISAATEIHAVAIDRAGNISTQVVGFYSPPVVSQPGGQPGALVAPTLLQPSADDVRKTSVKLTWEAVPNATSYKLTAMTDAGTALPATQQPGETTALSQTVAGLSGSTTYSFTVVAMNAGGSSAASNAVTVSTPENLTVTTARWRSKDFRVTGTSSASSGTVTVWKSTEGGAVGEQLGTLAATLDTAVAPATGTTYDWRMRAGVPPNPGWIVVKSSAGAVAGPFQVTS